MLQLIDEIKLLTWMCSSNYWATLHNVFDRPRVRAEWFGTLNKVAKKYFPFFNTGYFQNYDGLKKQTEENVGVAVKEIPMTDNVMGAYLPQGNGTILINNQLHPVFKLSTLAHELSHVGVCEYYQQYAPHESSLTVKNRVPVFKESLQDKEEMFADALIAVGTYPVKDFEAIFSKKPVFSLAALIKAIRHLKKHYPDVAQNFFFSRAVFLNMALIVHFLRLRIFLYKELAV
ncbi:ImmA/IrrE family metallo-endopeptidase [bacterium]|nr:ImmA/IrrE family metallo-endopeptidase [bacterium]